MKSKPQLASTSGVVLRSMDCSDSLNVSLRCSSVEIASQFFSGKLQSSKRLLMDVEYFQQEPLANVSPSPPGQRSNLALSRRNNPIGEPQNEQNELQCESLRDDKVAFSVGVSAGVSQWPGDAIQLPANGGNTNAQEVDNHQLETAERSMQTSQQEDKVESSAESCRGQSPGMEAFEYQTIDPILYKQVVHYSDTGVQHCVIQAQADKEAQTIQQECDSETQTECPAQQEQQGPIQEPQEQQQQQPMQEKLQRKLDQPRKLEQQRAPQTPQGQPPQRRHPPQSNYRQPRQPDQSIREKTVKALESIDQQFEQLYQQQCKQQMQAKALQRPKTKIPKSKQSDSTSKYFFSLVE